MPKEIHPNDDNFLYSLPLEIILKIFDLLSKRDLIYLMLSSKEGNALASNDHLWFSFLRKKEEFQAHLIYDPTVDYKQYYLMRELFFQYTKTLQSIGGPSLFYSFGHAQFNHRKSFVEIFTVLLNTPSLRLREALLGAIFFEKNAIEKEYEESGCILNSRMHKKLKKMIERIVPNYQLQDEINYLQEFLLHASNLPDNLFKANYWKNKPALLSQIEKVILTKKEALLEKRNYQLSV